MHALKGAGGKEPVEEFGPADAERVLQILTRTCSETVDGNGKVANDQSRHVTGSRLLDAAHLSAVLYLK
ncbi:MAG: hypothetical protein ABSB49_17295 [Polyangia bacterium]